MKQHCTATRKDGQPCRAWPLRRPDTTLCATHHRHTPQPAPILTPHTPGLYEQHITDEEFAIADAAAHQPSLDPELLLIRIILHRLFAGFLTEAGLTPAPHDNVDPDRVDPDQRALTIFKGAELVARLLHHRQEFQGEYDPARTAIQIALDELSAELEQRAARLEHEI